MVNEPPITRESDIDIVRRIRTMLALKDFDKVVLKACYTDASNIMNGDTYRMMMGEINRMRDAHLPPPAPLPAPPEGWRWKSSNGYHFLIAPDGFTTSGDTNVERLLQAAEIYISDCNGAVDDNDDTWNNCAAELQAVGKAVIQLDRQMAIAAAIDLLQKLTSDGFTDDSDIIDGIRAAFLEYD